MDNQDVLKRLDTVYKNIYSWKLLRPIIYTFLSNNLLNIRTYRYKSFNKTLKLILKEIFSLCLMLKYPYTKYESFCDFMKAYPEFSKYFYTDQLKLYSFTNNINTFIKIHKRLAKGYSILFSGLLEPEPIRYIMGSGRSLSTRVREYIFHKETETVPFGKLDNIFSFGSYNISTSRNTICPYFTRVSLDDIGLLKSITNKMLNENNKRIDDMIMLIEANNPQGNKFIKEAKEILNLELDTGYNHDEETYSTPHETMNSDDIIPINRDRVFRQNFIVFDLKF